MIIIIYTTEKIIFILIQLRMESIPFRLDYKLFISFIRILTKVYIINNTITIIQAFFIGS